MNRQNQEKINIRLTMQLETISQNCLKSIPTINDTKVDRMSTCGGVDF